MDRLDCGIISIVLLLIVALIRDEFQQRQKDAPKYTDRLRKMTHIAFKRKDFRPNR